MSIQYLLDGYNIIHQMPTSKLARLEDRRRDLIRFIEQNAPQGSRTNQVTVVFDGNPDVFGNMESSVAKIVFSQGESADDRIRAMVAGARNAKNITVVSDDRDIQYAVRALGAKVCGVRDFLARRKPAQSRKKRSGEPEAAPEKYISKTDEAKINTEMGNIWLKPDQSDD